MTRIIGDIHGKVPEYLNIISDCSTSVQLGDFGFSGHYDLIQHLDPYRHKFIPGNHDDYENLPEHALQGFGHSLIENTAFFYLSGEESIDRAQRTPGIDWWPQEQLSVFEMRLALQYYNTVSPKIVLSHGGPWSIAQQIISHHTYPSTTSLLLDKMLQCHTPELWIFGHHHKSFNQVIGGTRFICLPELEYVDI